MNAAGSRRVFQVVEGAETTVRRADLGPEIVASQADVVPAERRHMSQEFVGNGFARRSQMVCGAPEVNAVPVDDRRGDEIEAGGAIGLVFECGVLLLKGT